MKLDIEKHLQNEFSFEYGFYSSTVADAFNEILASATRHQQKNNI